MMIKIINDPVHGFIQIFNHKVQKCIDHPYFQRLRHISQLGLTDYVYPGATHTRFHHALGAYHLMGLAIESLRKKGVEITQEEEEGALIAILYHDVGHGPFSHTLEGLIMKDVHHETLSLELLKSLNKEMERSLDLAISIFTNQYHKKFLYQLISSQLDVDRLDYLKRDSFYTGVVEGNIGVDRILTMLDVVDNQIVVHEKGVMSILNYLQSRTLMYWQVYLHKTVLSAEFMLLNIFKRLHELNSKNELEKSLIPERLEFIFAQNQTLESFIQIDESDIWNMIKNLTKSKDFVLSHLSNALLRRHLYKVQIDQPFLQISDKITSLHADIGNYFLFDEKISKSQYSLESPINILTKQKEVVTFQNYALDRELISKDFNHIQSHQYYYQFPDKYLEV